jgi:riboflavin biosynthesis pyrimidine reductase
LETLRGPLLPLPPRLARLYGTFRMPTQRTAAVVYSNFVSTLDGVVSLQTRGHAAGGDISGFNLADRMVMGLLRAVADVVIVGSGTFNADPHTVWTPEAICPELAADYQALRRAMHKRHVSLNVVVSTSGHIDLRKPVFSSGKVPALIVTTTAGAKRLRRQRAPDSVDILVIKGRRADIPPAAILEAAARRHSGTRILIEGGPRLLGDFYEHRLIDEQFLTLAPQLAGRDADDGRLSLIMGKIFAPRDPRWGSLEDVRRSQDHLFLRYSFRTP